MLKFEIEMFISESEVKFDISKICIFLTEKWYLLKACACGAPNTDLIHLNVKLVKLQIYGTAVLRFILAFYIFRYFLLLLNYMSSV